jgi:hypothetical protein
MFLCVFDGLAFFVVWFALVIVECLMFSGEAWLSVTTRFLQGSSPTANVRKAASLKKAKKS